MKRTKKKWYGLIILSGIILLSIILRFYLLGSNPPSLDWDEASIGYNAYSILNTGKDEYGNYMPMSFRSFDDYKPPVYIYLTVPFVAIFGLTELAVRLPAAIIGVLAVAITYFFVKELLSSIGKRAEYIALLSSFFLAISPWHLQFSRAAFEGNIGMFFLILSLYLFLKSLKKQFYLLPFAFCFLLSMYSYHSFRLLNPILLVVLTVLFIRPLITTKLLGSIALILIVIGSIPIYSSFINSQGTGARLSMVTIFQDDQLQKLASEKTNEAKENGDIINQIIYNRRVIFIPQMIKGYIDHFDFGFLFIRGDGGVQHHAYNMGMLYLWDFPFILLGLYYLTKKFDRRILLLLLVFIFAPIPSSITTGTPHPIRAINMIPAFHIFASAGFVYCFYLLKKKQVGRILLTCIALLFIVNVTYYLNSYYVLTPIKYGYFWQYGNKQAVEYAKLNESKYSRIIMSYEYDQPYIYYLFHNKIDPEWYQKNWNYSGTGEIDRFYRKIGKYEFRNIKYDRDRNLSDTLLIATPKEVKNEVGEYKIFFPDGKLAYKIIKSDK